LREAHPRAAGPFVECRGNRAGMVLVKKSGLIMKLRGMIRKLLSFFLRANRFCFIVCRNLFFFFPFDRRWSFL
jgi:hypothetical protein